MAQSEAKKIQRSAPSTQRFLPFSEIRENTVIMKDGTLRAVLLVSSINFALKSEEEQKAIISGYVSFLNTLDFPLQIVVQSRKLNIEGYLELLNQKQKEQLNDLLRVQIQEYKQYITQLVSLAEIMEKRFYVVVYFSPFSKKKKSWLSRAAEVVAPASIVKLQQEKFRKYKEELVRRTSFVKGGLVSLGLAVSELDTQSLIELLYKSYNPQSISEKELTGIDKIRLEEL